MVWRVDYAATAKRQLRKLDKQAAQRIVDYMDGKVLTRDDPRSLGKALAGPLGDLWRYRIGNYRVVCDIQDEVLRILVVRVGRRDQAYR